MNIIKLTKFSLSLVLFCIAIWFATRQSFFLEAITSLFFSIALGSAVLVHWRINWSGKEVIFTLFGTLLLGIIDIYIMHYPQSVFAWISFAGLSSFAILALHTVWDEGSQQKLFFMAFIFTLLFVISEYFASDFLAWTEAAHPYTLDLYLLSWDASLRVQLPALLGKVFAQWPWFYYLSLTFYIGLPLSVAMVSAGQLLRMREKALPLIFIFLITGPVGIIFYNLIPAIGPSHSQPGNFPFHIFTIDEIRQLHLKLFLAPSNGGPRNAFPSLHIAWMLLAWWFSKRLSILERSIALAFLIFTSFAAMGTGEHYFIDAVTAFPFALMLHGLCLWTVPIKNKARIQAFLFGFLTLVAWMLSLRYTPHFFWISPMIPWILCVITIGGSVYFERRLNQCKKPS